VTGQLTPQAEAAARSTPAGSALLAQYNDLGRRITQLRAQIGLLLSSGQPASAAQVQELVNQWNQLAAQQSQVLQRINALPPPPPPVSAPPPGAPAPAVTVQGTTFTPLPGATVQQSTSAPPSYVGSRTYAPAAGGIIVYGVGGTSFFAPVGSSVYNSLVGGG
jgi:uncharacterized phage infection (PIP) family protein YhgE